MLKITRIVSLYIMLTSSPCLAAHAPATSKESAQVKTANVEKHNSNIVLKRNQHGKLTAYVQVTTPSGIAELQCLSTALHQVIKQATITTYEGQTLTLGAKSEKWFLPSCLKYSDAFLELDEDFTQGFTALMTQHGVFLHYGNPTWEQIAARAVIVPPPTSRPLARANDFFEQQQTDKPNEVPDTPRSKKK